MLWILGLAHIRAKSSKQSLFYNNALNSSCSWLNTVLKVKNRTVVWGQNCSKVYWLLTSWSCGWLGAVVRCHCPTSWESIVLHITNPGKDTKVQLLLDAFHFHTIVNWKIIKSNYHKSGTICISNNIKTKLNSLSNVKEEEENEDDIYWLSIYLFIHQVAV